LTSTFDLESYFSVFRWKYVSEATDHKLTLLVGMCYRGFGSAIPGVRHSGGPPFWGITVIITSTLTLS